MRQKTLSIYFFSLAVIVFAAGFVPRHPVTKTARMAYADSVLFIPNTDGGWSVYSYYFNKDALNKVEFEIILKHANNINWAKEQWIGTIKGDGHIPKTDRNLTYNLLPNISWIIRIGSNGKCFLKITKGSVPAGDPVIIPIKVKY